MGREKIYVTFGGSVTFYGILSSLVCSDYNNIKSAVKALFLREP